ncbi:hypothetical protein Btru_062244 [Bulinus truncatus]|nr:hypothetical protein Btru_062244 [Bulinus truncatus]
MYRPQHGRIGQHTDVSANSWTYRSTHGRIGQHTDVSVTTRTYRSTHGRIGQHTDVSVNTWTYRSTHGRIGQHMDVSVNTWTYRPTHGRIGHCSDFGDSSGADPGNIFLYPAPCTDRQTNCIDPFPNCIEPLPNCIDPLPLIPPVTQTPTITPTAMDRAEEEREVLEPLNPPQPPEPSVAAATASEVGGRFNVQKIDKADEPLILAKRQSLDNGGSDPAAAKVTVVDLEVNEEDKIEPIDDDEFVDLEIGEGRQKNSVRFGPLPPNSSMSTRPNDQDVHIPLLLQPVFPRLCFAELELSVVLLVVHCSTVGYPVGCPSFNCWLSIVQLLVVLLAVHRSNVSCPVGCPSFNGL